jgi:antitoxin (DNA-binding transcriptional repressor) of toxin-antitoxin stability system
MRTTGVRKFKDHLSSYLRAVDEGDVVIITRRGSAGYELRAKRTSPAQKKKELRELVARLREELAQNGPLPLAPDRLARVLEEQREDRL